MKYEAIDVIILARAQIEDESDWCQGRAMGADGEMCASHSYCTAATELRTAGTSTISAWETLLAVARQDGYDGPAALNDATDHKRVLEMFDEAASLLAT